MSDFVRYRVSGHSGYEVSCGDAEKTRIVFAMFDEDKTRLAWYLFSSKLDKLSCGKGQSPSSDQFGYHDVVASNPKAFHKKIALDKLVGAKGAPAKLNMSSSERMADCAIGDLTTTAGELVELTPSMQVKRKPANAGKDIKGAVYFLEMVEFSEKAFKAGPQEKASQSAIFGPVF